MKYRSSSLAGGGGYSEYKNQPGRRRRRGRAFNIKPTRPTRPVPKIILINIKQNGTGPTDRRECNFRRPEYQPDFFGGLIRDLKRSFCGSNPKTRPRPAKLFYL